MQDMQARHRYKTYRQDTRQYTYVWHGARHRNKKYKDR